MTGFEPATPTSRTWCATELRYIPKLIENHKYKIYNGYTGIFYDGLLIKKHF